MYYGQKLELAVSDTVSIFNSVAGGKVDLLEMCGLNSVGGNLIGAMKQEDKERISAAEAKISDGTKLSHQKLRGERKRMGETLATTYFPGAFGLSKTPDFDLDGEVLKKKDKPQKKSKKLEKKTKEIEHQEKIKQHLMFRKLIQKK